MKSKVAVILLTTFSLVIGASGAFAGPTYSVESTQLVSPVLYGSPVWSGEVPRAAASIIGNSMLDGGTNQDGSKRYCVGPATALSFSFTGLWRSSLNQTVASVKIEGTTDTGQVVFSGASSANAGDRAINITDSLQCLNPYAVSGLKITTTVSTVGTATTSSTVNYVPYSLARAPEVPLAVFHDLNRPVTTINETTVTTSYYADTLSFPAITTYKLGLAQADTQGELTDTNPSNVIELGTFDSVNQEFPVERIAALITNPNGFFNIEAKGVNSVGEGQYWSLSTQPLSSKDLLATYNALKAGAAAETAARAAAQRRAAQAAGTRLKYRSCSSLNQLFPGGISASSKTKNSGKPTKQKPYVSSAGYKLNIALDSDKDGIVCEK